MSSSLRPITVIDVPALDEWPAELPWTGQRFTLLLVLDEQDPSADKCAAWQVFAERVIAQGLAYFCTWGPHCELAHDLMDETLIARKVLDGLPEAFLMTTWHANEPLHEAIWFARHNALDLELQDTESAPTLIAVINDPLTSAAARRAIVEA